MHGCWENGCWQLNADQGKISYEERRWGRLPTANQRSPTAAKCWRENQWRSRKSLIFVANERRWAPRASSRVSGVDWNVGSRRPRSIRPLDGGGGETERERRGEKHGAWMEQCQPLTGDRFSDMTTSYRRQRQLIPDHTLAVVWQLLSCAAQTTKTNSIC